MNQTNQTEDLFSCYSPSVEGYRYFAVLWGCAVNITGTVGNMMTILAFAFNSRLRTRFNVLIVNLAVADLLNCTILQPFSIDSYLHLRWRSGELWCRTFGLLFCLSNCVSIITLCLIAVSRYLLVAKRAVFDRVFSNHGLILLLIVAWALGLVSFGPLWSVYVFVPQVCTCSFHRIQGRPYTTILLSFCFFIGLGCVGAFYLLIYRHVLIASQALLRYRFSYQGSRRKPTPAQETDDTGVTTGTTNTCSQAQLPQNMETTWGKPCKSSQSSFKILNSLATESPPETELTPPSITPTPANTTSVSHSTAVVDDKEIKYVTRMCLTVFLCFVFCFVPFLLLNIVEKLNHAPQVVHMFCTNLTWLNSCINPMLYAVLNRQFRQAYHVQLTKAAAPFTYLWNHHTVQSS
ncbi:G-protein coupled receptor 84-like [Archocentrus centrarchus]|uniref:G-protein coupled receptor 84-like n=1 Tax=Archocentrus centrarchus TaxID=63155 RepID=UPI0011EA1D9A|nr:G-protein coupled receptor 84-like [Archocentrus centrarchus]